MPSNLGSPRLGRLLERPTRRSVGAVLAEARAGTFGPTTARALAADQQAPRRVLLFCLGLIGLIVGAAAVVQAVRGEREASEILLFLLRGVLIGVAVGLFFAFLAWFVSRHEWNVRARVVAMARQNDAVVVPRADPAELPAPLRSGHPSTASDVVRWPSPSRRVETGTATSRGRNRRRTVRTSYLAVELLAPAARTGLQGDTWTGPGRLSPPRVLDQGTARLVTAPPYRMTADVADGWFVVRRRGAGVGADAELWRRFLAIAERVVAADEYTRSHDRPPSGTSTDAAG